MQGTNAHVVLEAKSPELEMLSGSPLESILSDPQSCWKRSSFWFKPLTHPLLLSCSRALVQGIQGMGKGPVPGFTRFQMQLDTKHPRLSFLMDHRVAGMGSGPYGSHHRGTYAPADT